MSDGYTLYDWSLLITREDTIVHKSHKIYPTVTSPEGGSFSCWDGLCHEIEWDSPRSYFPRQTFVGDSGRLLLTHSRCAMARVKLTGEISCFAPRLYQKHGYTLGHPHKILFCELELGYNNVSSDGFVSYTGYYINVLLC